MKRRIVITALASLALLVGSCGRMEERGARYDPQQCPFCSTNPGTCTYCSGSGECTFCEGTGKRVTVAPEIEAEGIDRSSYEEECPYCEGTGKCRYCDGEGDCWACNGKGEVESWDFFEKYQKTEAQQETPPGT